MRNGDDDDDMSFDRKSEGAGSRWAKSTLKSFRGLDVGFLSHVIDCEGRGALVTTERGCSEAEKSGGMVFPCSDRPQEISLVTAEELRCNDIKPTTVPSSEIVLEL
jgi:hypothetical protein